MQGGRIFGLPGEISSDVDWLMHFVVLGLDAQHDPVQPPIGKVLVDQQNLGHVEWWRWSTNATPYGFRFDVVPPPPVVEKPSPRPANANDWTTYGDQTVQWTPASGTVGPWTQAAPWFTITDQGNVWYLRMQFATTSTPGAVKWYRSSASPPWLFAGASSPGPVGTFLPLTSAVTLPAGWVTLTEKIPVQPATSRPAR